MPNNGILVGCDENQEWMLPWWWSHYSKHNVYPVAFADFGMSKAALHWCAQHGSILSLPQGPPRVSHKEEISSAIVHQWESSYGTEFWAARLSWFYKPIAIEKTPFDTTLWLDLDCEVKADLSLLFSTSCEIALSAEPLYAQERVRACAICHPDEVLYNSGVILYKKASPLISLWAEAARNPSVPFWSDQHLLSRLIYEKRHPIEELSPLYNWHMALGDHPEAKIIHWLGERGKMYIRLHFNRT